MRTSESIAAISAALAKAQGAMGGAVKDRQNPHFRSDYATLASVIDAGRAALATNGLACVQGLSAAPDGLIVTTRLVHASGEWIEEELCIPVAKRDAQGLGSAATYGRRYALAAMLGIAQVDDDGNAAVSGPATTYKPPKAPAAPTDEQMLRLQELLDAALNGTDALKAAWTALPTPDKKALAGHLDSLKTTAANAKVPA